MVILSKQGTRFALERFLRSLADPSISSQLKSMLEIRARARASSQSEMADESRLDPHRTPRRASVHDQSSSPENENCGDAKDNDNKQTATGDDFARSFRFAHPVPDFLLDGGAKDDQDSASAAPRPSEALRVFEERRDTLFRAFAALLLENQSTALRKQILTALCALDETDTAWAQYTKARQRDLLSASPVLLSPTNLQQFLAFCANFLEMIEVDATIFSRIVSHSELALLQSHIATCYGPKFEHALHAVLDALTNSASGGVPPSSRDSSRSSATGSTHSRSRPLTGARPPLARKANGAWFAKSPSTSSLMCCSTFGDVAGDSQSSDSDAEDRVIKSASAVMTGTPRGMQGRGGGGGGRHSLDSPRISAKSGHGGKSEKSKKSKKKGRDEVSGFLSSPESSRSRSPSPAPAASSVPLPPLPPLRPIHFSAPPTDGLKTKYHKLADENQNESSSPLLSSLSQTILIVQCASDFDRLATARVSDVVARAQMIAAFQPFPNASTSPVVATTTTVTTATTSNSGGTGAAAASNVSRRSSFHNLSVQIPEDPASPTAAAAAVTIHPKPILIMNANAANGNSSGGKSISICLSASPLAAFSQKFASLVTDVIDELAGCMYKDLATRDALDLTTTTITPQSLSSTFNLLFNQKPAAPPLPVSGTSVPSRKMSGARFAIGLPSIPAINVDAANGSGKVSTLSAQPVAVAPTADPQVAADPITSTPRRPIPTDTPPSPTDNGPPPAELMATTPQFAPSRIRKSQFPIPPPSADVCSSFDLRSSTDSFFGDRALPSASIDPTKSLDWDGASVAESKSIEGLASTPVQSTPQTYQPTFVTPAVSDLGSTSSKHPNFDHSTLPARFQHDGAAAQPTNGTEESSTAGSGVGSGGWNNESSVLLRSILPFFEKVIPALKATWLAGLEGSRDAIFESLHQSLSRFLSKLDEQVHSLSSALPPSAKFARSPTLHAVTNTLCFIEEQLASVLAAFSRTERDRGLSMSHVSVCGMVVRMTEGWGSDMAEMCSRFCVSDILKSEWGSHRSFYQNTRCTHGVQLWSFHMRTALSDLANHMPARVRAPMFGHVFVKSLAPLVDTYVNSIQPCRNRAVLYKMDVLVILSTFFSLSPYMDAQSKAVASRLCLSLAAWTAALVGPLQWLLEFTAAPLPLETDTCPLQDYLPELVWKHQWSIPPLFNPVEEFSNLGGIAPAAPPHESSSTSSSSSLRPTTAKLDFSALEGCQISWQKLLRCWIALGRGYADVAEVVKRRPELRENDYPPLAPEVEQMVIQLKQNVEQLPSAQ